MKRLLVPFIVLAALAAQPRLGNGLKPATITSSVPASAHAGEIFWISDGCSGGSTLQLCKSDGTSWALVTGSGSMVYPGVGIPQSTGSAWGSSVTLATSVGIPGIDTKVPTEKAVRSAIAAAGGLATLTTIGAGWIAPFGMCDYCLAGSGITAHDIWAFQFVPAVGITVSTIAHPNGANVAGAYGAFCIYPDVNGSPGTLLGQTTPFSIAVASSTAIWSSMASSVALTAGTPYWLGVTADTTGMIWMQSGTSTSYMWNQASHPRIIVAQSGGGNQSTGTGAGLTCPSTLGAATGSASHLPVPVRLLP